MMTSCLPGLRVVTPMANRMPRRPGCARLVELHYEMFGFLPKRRAAHRPAGAGGRVQRLHRPGAARHNSVTVRRGFDGKADGPEGTSILDPLRAGWRALEGDGRRDERRIQD